MGQLRIQRSFKEVQFTFPKLKGYWNEENNSWCLRGELDILDDEGLYWDSFKIAIIIPKSYPYCVPIVIELSKKIPRDIDWHISQEGVCCVGMDHRLLWQAKRGIDLVSFIRDEVYPYLANQLYKKATGKYVSGEYDHHFAGVKQFYKDDLGLTDNGLTIQILKSLLDNELPGRNDLCFCKNQKFKKCRLHFEGVTFLKSIEKERLKKDLEGFLKLKMGGSV